MKPGQYFDEVNGILDAEVFASPEVYRRELNSVFARSWLLVAPQSWLSAPGDYVTNFMGTVPVISWRSPDGEIEVFLNQCPSGTGTLTSSERGNAAALRCSCHGLMYAPDRTSAVRRPHQVPRVAQFSGFVFATLSSDVRDFNEELGDFRWCWGLIADQFPGGIEVYGNGSLQSHIDCNWKLAAEFYSGDVYSDATLTHATRDALELGEPLASYRGIQIATRSGAIVTLTDGDNCSTYGNESHALMTPILATMFPNISYDGRCRALHLWHPRGSADTDVYTYCLVGQNETQETKTARLRQCQLLFGPTGLLANDYSNVWTSITKNIRHAGPQTLNLQMGLGNERITNIPGRVSDLASEMNQRAFFGWWQEHLSHSAQNSHADRIKVGFGDSRSEPQDVQ